MDGLASLQPGIDVAVLQVAMLWDELHTRQPWRAATAGGELLSFQAEAGNSSTLLLVIAINTVRIPRWQVLLAQGLLHSGLH